MKNIYKHFLGGISIAAVLLSSCQKLDEFNPQALPLQTVYNERVGLEGAINGCYTDLYFFHGKIDFLGPTEMGTDSWVNTGSGETSWILYDNTLNTSTGTVSVIWNGLYALVNYCNTAIEYAKDVKGYATQAELDAKIAEAYFIRAYANFNLVEQFGGVVLLTKSAAQGGVDVKPQRSDEKAFYESIFSDLKFACANLPYEQSLRGRATKKAAYALLAKAYLQRTRLGDKEQYAKLALDAAEELISKSATYKCSLYLSDAQKSGFAKLWDENNNKTNTEFLFTQAVDASGLNPEGLNRGRTRQYYVADLGGRGAEWGTREISPLYSRSNTRRYKPSGYLMTSIFEPSATTPDTRFDNTFTTKYYANTDKVITQLLATTYQKDASVVGKTILGTSAPYKSPFFTFETSLMEEQKNMTGDAGLAVFTPNWTIDPAIKKGMPLLVADPSDILDPATGNYRTAASIPAGAPNLLNIYPSFKKFSGKVFAYSNQYWMGDIPVIRLGDMYLIAAEAAILYNNDQTKAAGYVNTIRKRAALTTREAEMVVPASAVTIDFLVKERGRELTGEHWRWYDLKRMGKLTKAYLAQTNQVVSVNFNESKHLKRPVPQSLLDAIVNADEFGTNGY